MNIWELFKLGGQVSGASGLPTTSVWECFLTTIMFGLLIVIPCSLIYQLLKERLDVAGATHFSSHLAQ